MPVIRIEVRDYFSVAMELLRREFSELAWPDGTSEDEFDQCSQQLTMSVDDELVGMIRLTSRPQSVMSAWAIGPNHIPAGNDIVEISRGVVARAWRSLGLYKLIVVEAARYCERAGVARIAGAIEPDTFLRGFLARIGFHFRGSPTRFRNPPKGVVWGQVMVQELALARDATMRTASECADQLRAGGFEVRSTVSELAEIAQGV